VENIGRINLLESKIKILDFILLMLMESLRSQFFKDVQNKLIFKHGNLGEYSFKNNEKLNNLTMEDSSRLINFENAKFNFLLKFYFMSSKFRPINNNEKAIFFKGVLDESITCDCGNNLREKLFLKGHFATVPPVTPFGYNYYLRVSESCETCRKSIWIYKDIGIAPIFFLFFFPSLVINGQNLQVEQDILVELCGIARLWLKTCLEGEFSHFHEEIIRFDDLLTEKFTIL